MVTKEQSLQYHQGGKVSIALRRALLSTEDLCMAYTPGVASAVQEIANHYDKVYDLTAKSNMVGVVSDGSAILGLGDLGATASIPVMEGKAVLFKAFAGIDAWPIPLAHCRLGGKDEGPTDPQHVIDAVLAIAPQYGGINLEDIAAPACFEIEDTLDRLLDIPVFHDDQWGTAIIVTAGVMNVAELTGKTLGGMKVVVNGAGAAGIRIVDMLKAAGVSDITMFDSRGVVCSSRTDLSEHKRRHSRVVGEFLSRREALRGADVFIGVSKADVLSGYDIKGMADYPAIFAMANPNPEIKPELVAKTFQGRPYIMATGRSDYPNQINNVLCFPFVFWGALKARAKTISTEMKVAAAKALAMLAREPVGADVKNMYPGERLEFGDGYILPKPFDKRLLPVIGNAVSEAAKRCAVSQQANN